MEVFIRRPGGGEGDRVVTVAGVGGRIIAVEGLLALVAEKLLVKSRPESARQEEVLFLPTASTRLCLDLGISGSGSIPVPQAM